MKGSITRTAHLSVRTSRSADRGQGMVEYSLILGLIAIIVVSVLAVVGRQTVADIGKASNGLSGQASAAAVSPTNQLLAWGNNAYGALGDGGTTGHATPVAVSMPDGVLVTAVSSSQDHSLALTSAGKVLAWGENWYGQLGNGSTAHSYVPVAVSMPEGSTVTGISAGSSVSLAVTTTGTVWAWGFNTFGQLGDATTNGSTTPVAVHLPTVATKVVDVSLGMESALGLTSDGNVLAWGSSQGFGLGDGISNDSTVPIVVALPNGVKVAAIAAGFRFNLALTSTGSVLAWGENNSGQLGSGNTTTSKLPIAIAGLTASALAAGGCFGLALTAGGHVQAWGCEYQGQLGNGVTSNVGGSGPCVDCSNVPVNVQLPNGAVATAISAAGGHSVALTSAGSMLAWGANWNGRLGDGTTTDRNVPGPVVFPVGATVAALGRGHCNTDNTLVLPIPSQ